MGQLLLVAPVSRNVSAGTLTNFTCGTPETGLTVFSITITPSVDGSTVTTHTNGGIKQLTLSFIAPAQYSAINILCIAIKGVVFDQSIAVLMIQGEPVSYCIYMNKINQYQINLSLCNIIRVSAIAGLQYTRSLVWCW